MNKEELEAFAREAAKGLKTEKDLNEFSQMLTKVAVEAALNAELDDHLGYSKHETSSTDNSRNGVTSKTLRTEDGQFELNTPRDRHGSFEPQLVKNPPGPACHQQVRLPGSRREGYSDYTTNAIESLNSVIRKVIKKRKLFPTDDSAKKVVYLAIRDASKKWTMPIYV